MKNIMLSLLILLMAAPALAQSGWRDCAPGHRCEAACFAQAGGHMERNMHGRHGDGPPAKMVEAFRLFKLTEYLELTEDQTEKIYPRMAEMNRLHDEHRERIHAKMKEVRELLEDEKAKEASKLAEEIHDLKGEFHALRHGKQGEIMDLLDENQRARYVLFEKRFEGHLKHVAERLHGRMGEHGAQGKHGKHGQERLHQGRTHDGG